MIHQPMLSMFASSNAGLCPQLTQKIGAPPCTNPLDASYVPLHSHGKDTSDTRSLPFHYHFFTDKSLSVSSVAHQIYHQVITVVGLSSTRGTLQLKNTAPCLMYSVTINRLLQPFRPLRISAEVHPKRTMLGWFSCESLGAWILLCFCLWMCYRHNFGGSPVPSWRG